RPTWHGLKSGFPPPSIVRTRDRVTYGIKRILEPMGLLSEPSGGSHYMAVGAIMFVAGAVCMATKRNALGILMGIELVLNGANVNLVAFGSDYLTAGRFVVGLHGQLI